MIVQIKPSANNDEIITLPPSKSLAHRYIIAACLSDGKSIIQNIDYSKDIDATLNAMQALNIEVERHDNYVVINGVGDLKLQQRVIQCEESGSTLRFLIPLFSIFNQDVTFIGKGRLLARPQDVYQKIANQQGIKFVHDEKSITINQSIKSGDYVIQGDISSQFITGLLFTLPLLKGDSKISVVGEFESKSYVDLTIDVLSKFGIKVDMHGHEITICGNQKYQAYNGVVEGDYSQLAFFAGLGTINNGLKIAGLNANSLQGDRAILKIIEDFNGHYQWSNGLLEIFKSSLVGCVVDLKDCPDLGPMVMVLAAMANGETKIINAARLRIKESDRILAMECELLKLGVDITSTHDTVVIHGQNSYHGGQMLHGHNDHRIVMALSILSSVCKVPNTIDDAKAINKSYPNFFKDLTKVGIANDYEN